MWHSLPPVPPAAAVEVTATRFPEDPARVPASITVLTARDLADRGARDLRGALGLLAGVTLAPGGDGGPAGAVPEFWGLKEFDAFLLVVDGVPWGGAFNPALSTLSLKGVERIEVQLGAAPVMYGATSFAGVIHVIRGLPSDATGSARLTLGDHGTFGGAVSLRLPAGAATDGTLPWTMTLRVSRMPAPASSAPTCCGGTAYRPWMACSANAPTSPARRPSASTIGATSPASTASPSGRPRPA